MTNFKNSFIRLINVCSETSKALLIGTDIAINSNLLQLQLVSDIYEWLDNCRKTLIGKDSVKVGPEITYRIRIERWMDGNNLRKWWLSSYGMS